MKANVSLLINGLVVVLALALAIGNGCSGDLAAESSDLSDEGEISLDLDDEELTSLSGTGTKGTNITDESGAYFTSCQELFDSGEASQDGTYYIDVSGDGKVSKSEESIECRIMGDIVYTGVTPQVAYEILGGKNEGALKAVNPAKKYGFLKVSNKASKSLNYKLPYTLDGDGNHTYHYTFSVPFRYDRFYFENYIFADVRFLKGANNGDSSEIDGSVFKQKSWDKAFEMRSNNENSGVGDIAFGSPSKIITSIAKMYGDQKKELEGKWLNLADDVAGTPFELSNSASEFRIGWGEGGTQNEGWIPWLGGTVFFGCTSEACSKLENRQGSGAIVVGNKMYIMHGETSSSTLLGDLWEYDTSTSKWSQKRSSPHGTERSFFASGLYNNKIYIFLGKGGAPHVLEYDLSTSEWTKIQTDDEPYSGYQGTAGVVIGNKFYVFGGRHNQLSGYNSARLWEFDLDSSKWTEKLHSGDYPLGRRFHSAVAYNDKMYILGGTATDLGSDTIDEYSDLWMYDPATNSWTAKASMSGSRAAHSAVVSNDKMYVFGGTTNGIYTGKRLLVYGFGTNSWSSIDTSLPESLSMASASLINGKILFFGGRSSGGLTNFLTEYDIDTGSVTQKNE